MSTSTSRHLPTNRSANGGAYRSPAALAMQPAHLDLIEQSHQRCAALGLSRIERPDYTPMMRSDLAVARERNRRLFTHAAPVMEMLFEQIVNTESMIVLTDAQGTILHSVGDDDFLDRAGKVALSPGVNWAEHSKGTNGMGTALFTESPTLVHAGEHFMHANSFLTCSAAPIFDPRGNMLGVLDVTGDERSYHQHTMGLVRMSARMIENHFLSDDYGNRLRLHFHSRVEFIGTLLEGIIVVGADGRIVGANRSALDQLDLSGAALRMHTLTSLFGTTASAVVDHFRAPLSVPMFLSLDNGRQFHVAARFNWQSRPLLSATADGAAPEAEPHREAAPEERSTHAPGAPHERSAPLTGLQFLQTGDKHVDSVLQKVRRTMNRDIPLLIMGAAGTGKELLARAVHQDSIRARQPFVAVNCAAVSEAQLETELFGYEDGAMSGARRKVATGRLVQANAGTLFLDNVSELPMALQTRLLRVLQERCVTPMGSHKSIPVDISLVAATQSNLRDLIEQQLFREDLYYRLNGLVVRLPALRERTDLGVVARRILEAECPENTPEISPAVMDLFRRYGWPGNIRQLANVLRTAAVMAAGERQITEAHLSDDFLEDVERIGPAVRPGASMTARMAAAAGPACYWPAAPTPGDAPGDAPGNAPSNAPAGAHAAPAWLPSTPSASNPAPAEPAQAAAAAGPIAADAVAQPEPLTLEQAELAMMRRAVEEAGGNISEAAKRLGISRNTIYRKLRWNQGR
jgi:sigma-54 dependent transcriptional regulator, acetoin dehydrogenase operon transcriptional activator AcoR